MSESRTYVYTELMQGLKPGDRLVQKSFLFNVHTKHPRLCLWTVDRVETTPWGEPVVYFQEGPGTGEVLRFRASDSCAQEWHRATPELLERLKAQEQRERLRTAIRRLQDEIEERKSQLRETESLTE